VEVAVHDVFPPRRRTPTGPEGTPSDPSSPRAAVVPPGEAHATEVVLAACPHVGEHLVEPLALGPVPLLEVLGPGEHPALGPVDDPISSAARLGADVSAGGHCCLIRPFPLSRPVTPAAPGGTPRSARAHQPSPRVPHWPPAEDRGDSLQLRGGLPHDDDPGLACRGRFAPPLRGHRACRSLRRGTAPSASAVSNELDADGGCADAVATTLATESDPCRRWEISRRAVRAPSRRRAAPRAGGTTYPRRTGRHPRGGHGPAGPRQIGSAHEREGTARRMRDAGYSRQTAIPPRAMRRARPRA